MQVRSTKEGDCYGASMNPARSLAPAFTSGVLGNLWLYWSATFVGTSIVALLVKAITH